MPLKFRSVNKILCDFNKERIIICEIKTLLKIKLKTLNKINLLKNCLIYFLNDSLFIN